MRLFLRPKFWFLASETFGEKRQWAQTSGRVRFSEVESVSMKSLAGVGLTSLLALRMAHEDVTQVACDRRYAYDRAYVTTASIPTLLGSISFE